MRLPYLQLSDDAWGHARVLAAMLGCDRHRAMSLLVDLWRWALEQGEGMPSGEVRGPTAAVRLAGAVEWPGKASDLAATLVDAELVERLDDGFRIRGLDRYETAFKRQEADRQRKASARAVRKSSGQTAPSAGSPQDVRRTSDGSPRGIRSIDVDVDVDVRTAIPPARESGKPGGLQQALSDSFEQLRGASYSWSWEDEAAGRKLLQLAQGNEAEAVRRWRNALQRTRFPTCDSVKDLIRHWNAYATEQQPPPVTAPQRATSVTTRLHTETDPCQNCGKPGVREALGTWVCADCGAQSDAYWAKQASQ